MWMMFLLATLSVREIAFETSLRDFVFFARLITTSKLLFAFLFIASFLLELLKALLAVFVTGMELSLACEYNLSEPK